MLPCKAADVVKLLINCPGDRETALGHPDGSNVIACVLKSGEKKEGEITPPLLALKREEEATKQGI